ncbi:MAG: hypothetical protein SFV54_18140 [Bryobacteraceae bacterium]|nr:hypothetical protein [Bryobacteraceae bacterium]
MSLTTVSASRERIRFFNGQRLFAEDLEALEAFHREMRWLHNQSLHQPGVGSGFAVAGAKGAREVSIQPGYALDDLGREIVLTETRVEQVPPVAGDGYGGTAAFDLTVSYADDLKESEVRQGVCETQGAVRLREEPVFCWVRLGPGPNRIAENPTLQADLDSGRRVRLARAEVLQCKLEKPLSIAERRNARPPNRPFVACGESPTGGWAVETPSQTLGFGYRFALTVSTAAAGFRTVPRYLASVYGDRRFRLRNAANVEVPVMIDGFLSLTKATETGFDVSILVPNAFLLAITTGQNPLTPAQVQTQLTNMLNAADATSANRWRVQWIGVEG